MFEHRHIVEVEQQLAGQLEQMPIDLDGDNRRTCNA